MEGPLGAVLVRSVLIGLSLLPYSGLLGLLARPMLQLDSPPTQQIKFSSKILLARAKLKYRIEQVGLTVEFYELKICLPYRFPT